MDGTVGAYAERMVSMSNDAAIADAMENMLTMVYTEKTMSGPQVQHVIMRKWDKMWFVCTWIVQYCSCG